MCGFAQLPESSILAAPFNYANIRGLEKSLIVSGLLGTTADAFITYWKCQSCGVKVLARGLIRLAFDRRNSCTAGKLNHPESSCKRKFRFRAASRGADGVRLLKSIVEEKYFEGVWS